MSSDCAQKTYFKLVFNLTHFNRKLLVTINVSYTSTNTNILQGCDYKLVVSIYRYY